MRSIATLALMAGATVVAHGEPQPRFGARVDLLVVSAIVRSSDNALVRGLTRDDFELREDGKPVPIATFAEASTDASTSVDDGRFVVLLLDDFSTHPQYTKRIKDVAHRFADRMGPKDVMSVLMVNGSSSVTTQRPAEVHAAIERSKGYGKAMLSPGNTTRHAMETIASLATQLAGVPHRRKVLVCIGPAEIFNPATHLRGNQGEAGVAMRDTARANLTIYVIDPLGLNEKRSLSTRSIDDEASRQRGIVAKGEGFRDYRDGFAFESGGFAFANTNDYRSAIDQVWEESGNYYLLGYEPARRDNRRHTIEVQVKKPDVTVRARRTRG
jgi:VWFA-related protein